MRVSHRQVLRDVTTISRVLFLLLALVALPAPAAADVVTNWNAIAGAVTPRLGAPQQQSRAMAIVHIAIHDALNTIEPRFERYTPFRSVVAGASPSAAVAAAARRSLLELLGPIPDSPLKAAAIETIEAAYAADIGPWPLTPATEAGIDVGEAAAAAILATRVNDGSATPHLPYTLIAAPGVYQRTPNPEFPAVITPSFAGWAHVTPFVLNNAMQFEVEPGAILDISSGAYAADYNEVKRLGAAHVRGALANSEESDIARFWPGGGSNWNTTTRGIVTGRGLDPWEHARVFALLNVAVADTLIANQTWKYTYNFWRPITAIRWPEDGNTNTESDPSWRPFLVTPPYPDYPCALPSEAGAATEALRQFFGTDEISFTRVFNAPVVPLPAPMVALPAKVITRSYGTLSDAAAEAQSARVYAGIHFREGCVAGTRQGTQIARFVAQHAFRSAAPGRGRQKR